MKLHFFEKKKISRSSLEKDSTNQYTVSLPQEVKYNIRYSIFFLIITTTFLILIYLFVAYSFLETSSVLLINKHPYTKQLSKKRVFKGQDLFSKNTVSVNSRKFLTYISERKPSDIIFLRKAFCVFRQEKILKHIKTDKCIFFRILSDENIFLAIKNVFITRDFDFSYKKNVKFV